MPAQYEPSRREVYREMWNGFRKFGKEEIITPAKEFGQNFSTVFVGMSAIPYSIPLFIRERVELDFNSERHYTEAQKIGRLCGVISGIEGYILQVEMYNHFNTHGHPEVLAIPVVTNSISGLYEVGRLLYRKAKNRLIERSGGTIDDDPDHDSGHNPGINLSDSVSIE